MAHLTDRVHGMRSVAALATVWAALLSIAGCTDGWSGASTEPSPSVSNSAEPDPSDPTKATSTWTLPPAQNPPKGGWPEDKPATEITAEKVVRLWVASYSRANVTGDTTRMRRLATKACTECAKYADEIEQEMASGETITFTRPRSLVAGDLTLVDPKTAEHVELQMQVRMSGGKRVSADGGEVEFGPEQYEWWFVLTAKSGSWRIKKTAFVR